MIRRLLPARAPAHDPIRWRGAEPSRIESFSDAVFGFSITLLVLSVEIPKSYSGLIHLLHGVPAFAASFSLLATLWWRQCLFFRRYGLHDSITAALNTIQLFVIVLYIYPVKFFFDASFAVMFGDPAGRTMMEGHDENGLLAIYLFGAGVVQLLSGMMILHAFRMRTVLELTEEEESATLGSGFDALTTGLGFVGAPLVMHWLGLGSGLAVFGVALVLIRGAKFLRKRAASKRKA